MKLTHADKYSILRKIGQGTFGEVFLARDLDTLFLVALKRVLYHDKNAGFPIPTLREIQLLQQLSHPNIIRLLEITGTNEAFSGPGFVCLVMPYIKHDLLSLLRKGIFLEPSYEKFCIQKIILAVEYLHGQGILHRDIKASNIFIDEQGMPFLADFGLAKLRGVEEAPRHTPGVFTSWYRPPEVFFGRRDYGYPADMWAIGCLFGEILLKDIFIKGKSEIDQVQLINDLCGPITPETMPSAADLPEYKAFSFEAPSNSIENVLGGKDPLAIDLVKKILVLEPEKRLSATEALAHEYFSTEPLPAITSVLKGIPSSHEYQTKQEHQNNTGS